MYTFGINDNIMYSEYIPGITLLDYIHSDKYNVKEFISILLQIALALDMVGDIKFVHYDLFPWNIMLQRKTIDVQYRTISFKTNIVPVIIDYGRSQAGDFGYSAPPLEKLEYSHFQDILSLVLSSLSSILHVKYKSDRWYQIGRDKDVYINLINICTGKKFYKILEMSRNIVNMRKIYHYYCLEKKEKMNYYQLNFFIDFLNFQTHGKNNYSSRI